MNREKNLKRRPVGFGYIALLNTLVITLMMTGFVFGQDTTYTITVSTNPANGGTVTGGGTFDHGQNVTVTAIPETGYAFLDWTESGSQVSTDSSYSFTAEGNRELVANFTLNQYTVAVSINPANGGTVTGSGTYNHGQNVTVTAIPETGYAFLDWTESGSQVSKDSSYSFTAEENRELVANFNLNQYTVAVSANPANGGIVTGGGTYNHGQNVTVNAESATGYTFLNWTESGSQVSTDSSYAFTAEENRELVANFTLNQYTIAVSANPANGGTVTGGGTYNHGQNVTVNAESATGYTFLNWTESGNQVSTDSSYSFTAERNRELIANFTLNQYTIAVSANPADRGTVTGGGTYDHGQNVTVTAIPDTGYEFLDWTESGSQVSTDSSYAFTAEGNRELVANFIIKTYTIKATAGDNGGIAPSGDIIIEHGEDITFTITPDPDYLIEKLIIDGSEIDSSGTFTFQNVQRNHSIQAVFLIQIPDIPQLTSPLSGADEMVFNPELSWQTSNRAGTYNVQAATDLTFHPDSIIANINGLEANSYTLENLASGTQYFWRVSASNDGGTSEWSEIRNFTTIRLPKVTTETPADIRDISVTLRGAIVDLGQPHLTEYGFVWGNSPNPDVNDIKENLGSTSFIGTYTASINNLQPGTRYYVRTYAISAGNTVYGNEVQFTTTIATQLVVTQQPQSTPAGQPLPSISVEARDENDNRTISFNKSITVVLENEPENAFLGGTTIITALDGVAVFEDLSLTKAAEGYKIRFTASDLSHTISDTFNILPADPNYFIKISGDGQEGFINTELEEPFVVKVEDIYNNTIEGASVLFEITQYPSGATGQSLSKTNVQTGENGIAATTLTTGNSDGTYRVASTVAGTDLEIIFTISIGGTRLSGTVKEGGNPLGSVSITVIWDSSEPIITLTDNSGFYRIPGIPIGATNVKVSPSKTGYRFAPADTIISGPVTDDITNINFITTPPLSPELAAPANESENVPAQVTLRWQETERADIYAIQVAETEDFASEVIVEQNGIRTLSFSVDTLEFGKRYYWRVMASNPSGVSDWSDIWSFSVIPTSSHIVSLHPGWNMISSYIVPLDSALHRLFEPVIDNLLIIKDGAGNAFLPEYGIDNIKNWNHQNGYQLYLSPESGTLEIFGIKITPDRESLPLNAGWNMVGYLRNTPLDVELAVETITNKLIIIKNGSGQVYIPPGIVGDDPINTLETMKPGEGYQIYISENAELVYPGYQFSGTQTTDGTTHSGRSDYNQERYYHHPGNTGTNAIFIVKSSNLFPGDEIGVWNHTGELIGNGTVQSYGKATVVVWGENIYKMQKVTGAQPAEELKLTLWSPKTKNEKNIIILNVYDIIANKDLGVHLSFQQDAIRTVTVEVEDTTPESFVLYQNYPNPFNPSTTIAYAVPTDTHVLIEIYNLLGQKIMTIVDEKQQAGNYEIVFDGSAISSGTYFYRMQAGSFIDTNKFILLK
jgi:hypothetical protein